MSIDTIMAKLEALSKQHESINIAAAPFSPKCIMIKSNPIGYCNEAVTQAPKGRCAALEALAPKKKKQETTMYDTDVFDGSVQSTPDERKLSVFNTKLWNAYHKKHLDLWVEFKMDGTKSPSSPKEYVEYVEKGWFKFTKNYLNDDGTWREDSRKRPYWDATNFYNFVTWDNPEQKSDPEGYHAAEKTLAEGREKAERQMLVSTPAEALKVLEDFESQTFH